MARIVKVRIDYAPNRDQYGNDYGRYLDKEETLPAGAQYLSCKTQYNPLVIGDYELHIAVYFLVEVHNTTQDHLELLHRFRVIGTGEPFTLQEGEKFLNTIKRNEGEAMWHVFHQPPLGDTTTHSRMVRY